FVHRPEGPSSDASIEDSSAPATGESVQLPEISVSSTGNFVEPVETSAINAQDNLVGFQGDIIFDERVITFENQPVQKAGLTAGNWNVSGNVLPGKGPMR